MVRIVWVTALLVAGLCALACGGGGGQRAGEGSTARRAEAPAPAEPPRPAEARVVYPDGLKAQAALNTKTVHDLLEFTKALDNPNDVQFHAEERFILAEGTRLQIQVRRSRVSEVRVLDGEHAGKDVFLSNIYIRE